ncbi:N-acetylmuramoyl-L-alanine amidase-like domain-containing protein [Cyanobacterium sp. DS4]|uniref:N-acetylmuramoyl-L-alanine amidase-like domain-containing protein n=1 Tax=Cyanobacterium sp. DS4 TaxID=2878255 RepID=UPI002E80F361|nr:N-acetylmuramoyl-L-alanine amidase-like domain-containing protein [Cyanobacterium sp. Dongsha4]WVL00214.1 DUF1460 domain-containing protein [Cyanobacterium sp. Dongsha4]
MPKTICISLLCFLFLIAYPFKNKTESSPIINTLPVQTVSEKKPIGNNEYEEKKFQQIMNLSLANKLQEQSIEIILQTVAKEFMGAKYQAGLLDQTNKESLFISLTKFDCVLFVETVLGLVKGITVQDYNYSTFITNIQKQRYRTQNVTYCDRLHYFSDWIAENEKKGFVKNLTQSLGGIRLDKQLNFMTVNRSKYPQLNNNEINFQCIKKVEADLNKLNLSYIPTNKIKSIYPQLKLGDIIGITTKIKGLDVTHTGLIYRQNNQTGLIHASPAGQVTVAKDLQSYVQNVPQAIGIFVIRPLDPR